MNAGGRDVFLEMTHFGRAGNGQHDQTSLEDPRQRDLALSNLSFSGDAIEQRTRLGEAARGERIPRDETDALAFTISENLFAAAVGQIVAVLHGSHLEE